MRTQPNRKPCHLEYIGGKSPRQRIWELVRAFGTFARPELVEKLPEGIHPDTARTYLNSLVNGGYLERRQGHVYTLIQDTGIEAPRLRKDGTPVVTGRSQESLWRTLRTLDGPIGARALAALADTAEYPVSHDEALEYLKILIAAGYVRKYGESYRLKLNSGPRPPVVQRVHRVYDPNLGQVMWTEESRHE